MRATLLKFSAAIIVAVGMLPPALAAEPTQPVADHAGQIEGVQTLLRTRCVKCHGPLRPKGELNLSTLRGIARGGENGAVVAAGNPADSSLWEKVAADDMPPENPLSAGEKSLLKTWIEQGAAGLPANDPSHEMVGLDHWAFQRISAPPPPSVRDASHVRTQLDQFVQARLERRGLSLGPDADRSTLIRRVAFGLTGLPPTPAEIEIFLMDASADAYEKMVDRYLASPRYGERWGQYWLDAAGYADSSGYFSNERDRPLAWRYRDYVIAWFNADKPLAQFIREQLAGDELFEFQPGMEVSADQRDALVATQFLSNAPDGTDQSAASPDAMRVDRYAALEGTQEMISSCLLGLTIKCARCHDHKFEPVSQREYYAIQSILVPALNPKNWIPPLNRKLGLKLVGEDAAWKSRLAALEGQIAALERERQSLDEFVAKNRVRGEELFRADFAADGPDTLATWRMIDPKGDVALATTGAPSVQVADGALRILAGGGRTWLASRKSFDWTPDAEGAWIQLTFRLVSDRPSPAMPQAERVGYYVALRHPSEADPARGSVLIDGHPGAATSVYFDPPTSQDKLLGSIATEPYSPGLTYGVRVTHRGANRFRLEHIVDFRVQGTAMELSGDDLPDGAIAFYSGHNRSFIIDDVLVERGTAAAAAGGNSADAELAKAASRRRAISGEIQQLAAQRAGTPGEEIAWNTDTSPQPPEVFVLQRGAYGANGEPVKPAGLVVLSDPDNPFTVASAKRTTGRRLAFARWLTQPGSRPAALVARVQANRIWLHHFGRGLTPSAENFGVSGGPPSHEELLEVLAAALEASGGRMKALHREIMRSAVYRQTSVANSNGLRVDPDNRDFWRFPLQRLEAEAIRDGMLAASGELDLTAGGPAVPIEKKGSVQEVQRGPLNREVVVAESTPGALRRSIYLQHQRTQIPTVLALFGTPSISINCVDRRPATVPLQSLSQLNSDFIRRRAAALAARLGREAGAETPAHVARAFLLVAGREPTTDELRDSQEFIARQQTLYAATANAQSAAAPEKALTDFCQMLLASNLFLYIE